MINTFLKFLETENLVKKTDKILLAVSGGVDSVVMLHLFYKAKFNIEILHCNFCLRGKESDDDEVFVMKLGEKYNTKVNVKRFDTKTFGKKLGMSTQMAARDLRYKWFEDYRNKNNAEFIAVAHHKDDEIETFFINLIRGTGIKGLSGYKNTLGSIIRPLLFTHKEEIVSYARSEKLDFREDRSNNQDIYIRNYIRNNIIPMFQKLNPNFAETMQSNIENLKSIGQIMESNVSDLKEKLIVRESNIEKLNINRLKKLNDFNKQLFYLLQEYNFNSSVIRNIVSALDSTPGKLFYSETHRIIKDREWLIIEKLKDNKEGKESTAFITKLQSKISKPIKLTIRTEKRDGFSIPTSAKLACLDGSQLKYPLKIRPWVHGDFVYPLGMKNKKKLSDLFVDLKIPLNEKENIFVLESAGDIAWVIGCRIDNRFRITDKTKKVCLIEWLDGE